jgi:uracil-DNA glycosylase
MKFATTDSQFRMNEQQLLRNAGITLDAEIEFISNENAHVVFVLWGDYARKKSVLIDMSKHAIIESVHPSPLSAYRGFFGTKPFSKVNEQLKNLGKEEIKW